MSTAKKATVVLPENKEEKLVKNESSLTNMEKRIIDEFKKNCSITKNGMKSIEDMLDHTIDFANIISDALVKNDASITKVNLPYEIIDVNNDYDKNDCDLIMNDPDDDVVHCDGSIGSNAITAGTYKKRFTFEVNIDVDALLKKCFGDNKTLIAEFKDIIEGLHVYIDHNRSYNITEKHIWYIFSELVCTNMERRIDNYCNGVNDGNCDLVAFLYSHRECAAIKIMACWMIFSQILIQKFGSIINKNIRKMLNETGNDKLNDSFSDYNFASYDYNSRSHILTIQFAGVNTSIVDEWYQWLDAFDYQPKTAVAAN